MAEELLNDVDKAILFLNIPNVHDLSVISSPITVAATRTRTRLLITIFCTFFDDVAARGSSSWDTVQKLLTHAYVQATAVSQRHNKILMSIDVLLRGAQSPAKEFTAGDWDMIFYSGNMEGISVPQIWDSLPVVHLIGAPEHSVSTSSSTLNTVHTPVVYPVVVLGGTFDHIHAGHKILLSMAAWIAGNKIIVGVTDDLLLTKKVHKEFLEPLPVRSNAVRNFLRLFKPDLVYDVVPIVDVYGPTGWDPNIQALVVSKETLPGAASIAALRTEKAFPPLMTFVIDVISAVSADLGTDDPEILKNTKMSSTFIRTWIYENQKKVASSSTDHSRMV